MVFIVIFFKILWCCKWIKQNEVNGSIKFYNIWLGADIDILFTGLQETLILYSAFIKFGLQPFSEMITVTGINIKKQSSSQTNYKIERRYNFSLAEVT